MDLNEAKIFTLDPGQKHLELVRRKEIKHHTPADPENHKNTHRYFQEIAEHLRNAKEILLLGPGPVKTHFSKHLSDTYPHTLGRAIVGIETLDHVSDNQILETSRAFFRKHDPAKYPVA
jgi:stalled ribosome rescue protein Dom34